MEKRTLCHLGRYRHRHRCSVIPERNIYVRWLSSWSSSYEERREIRRHFTHIPFLSSCFWDLWSHKSIWFRFLYASGQRLSHLWWSSWNFFSLSTSFSFYSAFQFCLFLQLIWQPVSTIFWSAETHLEFCNFLDNFFAFGNQVPRANKKNNK